jgi:NADPH:quinone reductase-like Zn-dependent oxidoreductase
VDLRYFALYSFKNLLLTLFHILPPFNVLFIVLPTTMMPVVPPSTRAYHLYEDGPASNLKLEVGVPVPTIRDNEVLVQIKALSINPVDCEVRSSAANANLYLFVGGADQKLPIILGWDVAGIVVQVGSALSSLKVGDKVFGMVNFPGHGKAYAEYVTANADHLCTMDSECQTYAEAAAMTMAALTAWQALAPRVKQRDTVFIHAGSGGVGHYAIQIAKALGASKVITTSSAKNREFCMQMGAHRLLEVRL